MHWVDKYLSRNTRREPEDIVFTEADAKQVLHPYTDALVIIVRMANSNAHRMMVDNSSAVNILYWDAYKRKGLTECDLSLTNSLLYGFTRDHVIPRGTIKLVVIVGEHPRTSTVVTKFRSRLPISLQRSTRELLLKALRTVVLSHCLTMKCPMTMGIGQVQGRQCDLRQCYNKSLKLAEKERKLRWMIEVEKVSKGPMAMNIDPSL